ncbi:hypothetical protein AMS68_005572 [Peltaster fructicola]|uniref:Prenyltransferase alpha-alpha toroid domain-containing protein n=1 Tax=Peltaster fructicola TaxID=286661 RepID=A0A6H0XZF9_9PEZI|nr:hypothetical protein AMS68_005572 [Peltaster fructicola]
MPAIEDGAAEWFFDKDRHVKYWKRCLKTYLPTQYTSNDSNRMYLAYFMISAFELLDILDSSISDEERAGYRDWIYHCQHPNGGFRMWPGTDFGDRANDENAKWDPAHVPATYFALTTLLTLGDDLSRVKRSEALQWLCTMQRSDGSFGETRVDGHIEGGNDPRFGYCAAGCRYILLGQRSQSPDRDDIDLSALTRSIKISQLKAGNHPPVEIDALTRWLADRQTDLVDPDGSLDSEFVSKLSAMPTDESAAYQSAEASLLHPALQMPDPNVAAGMNGRLNKVADTCYCWWVGASLDMLGQGDLVNKPALRRYLLQLTQHPFMGGFCKFPDDKYADIYHSFMGLAALSLASTAEERAEDGIKEWDAEMCISKDVKRWITSSS